jgi:hypothetical protein
MTHKKYTFWVLLSLFLLPFVAATWLYHHASDFTFNTKNKGTLLNPVHHVSELSLPQTLDNTWWILAITPTCDIACEHTLFWLNQIQTALHKHSPRVQQALLQTKPNPGFTLPYPRMQALSLTISPSFLEEPAIVLVDPLGNIMMRYDWTADPNDIFKDLSLLLKNSQIG